MINIFLSVVALILSLISIYLSYHRPKMNLTLDWNIQQSKDKNILTLNVLNNKRKSNGFIKGIEINFKYKNRKIIDSMEIDKMSDYDSTLTNWQSIKDGEITSLICISIKPNKFPIPPERKKQFYDNEVYKKYKSEDDKGNLTLLIFGNTTSHKLQSQIIKYANSERIEYEVYKYLYIEYVFKIKDKKEYIKTKKININDLHNYGLIALNSLGSPTNKEH